MAENKTQLALKTIDSARAKGANLLLPTSTLEGLSKYYYPIVEHILLSPKVLDRDVYPSKGKLRLTKQALMKISLCAGIEWSSDCGRTDDGKDKLYVSFRAIGAVRKSSGEWYSIARTYELDLEVIEMEITDQYESKKEYPRYENNIGKCTKRTPEEQAVYVAKSVRKDMIQKRKHKLKLAETGAMNRVIRDLLGLKDEYTEADMKKPFMAVRIIKQIDDSDPRVRKALVEDGLRSITNTYVENPHDLYLTLPEESADTPKDVTPDSTPKQKEETPPDNSDSSDKPDDDAPKEGTTGDFETCSPEAQITTLERLIKQKAYNTGKFTKPMQEWGTFRRVQFFEILIALPDDDIPF